MSKLLASKADLDTTFRLLRDGWNLLEVVSPYSYTLGDFPTFLIINYNYPMIFLKFGETISTDLVIAEEVFCYRNNYRKGILAVPNNNNESQSHISMVTHLLYM